MAAIATDPVEVQPEKPKVSEMDGIEVALEAIQPSKRMLFFLSA